MQRKDLLSIPSSDASLSSVPARALFVTLDPDSISNDKGSLPYWALLERALRGEPVKVVATTSDRVTRSGVPLIRHIFERSGGRIELLEEDDHAEQFDVKYLVAHIPSFCNSQHGKRAGQRHKKDPGLSEG